MKYYVDCELATGKAGQLIGGEVIGVRDGKASFKLDNGARLGGYGGKIYNENEEEVPFEEVERNFLSTSTEALLARIAQLEAMVTGGGTNV